MVSFMLSNSAFLRRCTNVNLTRMLLGMQSKTENSPLHNEGTPLIDARTLLLEEVHFKWLMAGLGCWIDMARFRSDSSYADRYLKLAASAQCQSLRKCATVLLAKNGL